MGDKPLDYEPPQQDEGGRPSKYDSQYCEDILEYFDTEHTYEREITHTNSKGDEWTEYKELPNPIPTIAGFAGKIGVCKATVKGWAYGHGEYKKIEEFSAAYMRAKTLYEARIADLGARGFLNPAFTIFLAKNTMDWKDKTETDNTHNFPQMPRMRLNGKEMHFDVGD